MAKPIRLSGHARLQLVRRGVNEQEVVEAIRTEQWQTGERGSLECRKDYVYEKDWNGRTYGTKQVRPIFVEETEEIVVITVYSYFF